MDHDRLFKELLRTFFVEFLELFLPEVAAYLDRRRVEFLDKEVFTDVTAGDRHEVDLLAKARFKGRDAFFLIHVESQATAREAFPKRMFRYFARLHEKYDLPVYPIAVFSYDAPRRRAPGAYRVEFPDKRVLDFSYRVIQLNQIGWRGFLKNPNPVAAALMAKMRIAPRDRPRVKAQCLRMLLTLKLDAAKQKLIWGFVESYLALNRPERARFNRAVGTFVAPDKETTMEYLNSFLEEGKKLGRREGRREGQKVSLLKGRERILRLLRRLLGDLPPTVEGRVAGASEAVLDDLSDALLDFTSVADVEAWFAARRRPRAARAAPMRSPR